MKKFLILVFTVIVFVADAQLFPGSITNTTDVYTELSSMDDESGQYYLSVKKMQNPLRADKVVCVFMDSEQHTITQNAKLSLRISNDRGVTFGTKQIFYNPAGQLAPYDLAMGYDTKGRLHVITDVHTVSTVGVAGYPKYLKHLYSDDDGTTWIEQDITSALISDSMTHFLAYGDVIDFGDGTLVANYYKMISEADQSTTAVYTVRSSDWGVTWTSVLVEQNTGSVYRNEGTIARLSSTDAIIIARDEQTKEWRQYKTTDKGLTYTNQGVCSFGLNNGTAGPARLDTFYIGTQLVVACTYPDRSNSALYQSFSTPSQVLSGVNWFAQTVIVDLPGNNLGKHYGNVLYLDGHFNSTGVYAQETGSLSDNVLTHFTMPIAHYQTVKTALGL